MNADIAIQALQKASALVDKEATLADTFPWNTSSSSLALF